MNSPGYPKLQLISYTYQAYWFFFGWVCISVVDLVISMCKPQYSIVSTMQQKLKQKQKPTVFYARKHNHTEKIFVPVGLL
jgi:hypothetical protein